MGLSLSTNQFRFNGVVSTDKSVTQNFEAMCAAAMCWVTYDSKLGKWAVVINRAGSSVFSFDDRSIVGPISVDSTGLSELYNSVKVEFPNAELNDRIDFVSIAIPDEDRNPNEIDNELVIQSDIINDPVQAQYIGLVELKQNRLEQVVRFATDFVGIRLMAGDVIDITADMYGWDRKLFRVISIQESDTDEGTLVFDISAVEYSDNVYSTADLERFGRIVSPGLRALGAIETPVTPAITVFTQVANPRAEITAIVPEGVVNAMELYASRDAVNFTFVAAVFPDGGGAFTTGQQVTFDYSAVRTGTLFVRVRATNSAGSSDFSPVGSTAIDLQLKADLFDATFDRTRPFVYTIGALEDQYQSDGQTFNAIVADSASMLGFNIPPGQSTPAFIDYAPNITQARFILRGDALALAARSNPKGVAVYYNWAPWDSSAYATGGLAALDWATNWSWLGSFRDLFSDISGNNAFISASGSGEVFPFDASRMNGQPGVVIFGISTTIVKYGVEDLSQGTDPVSGVAKAIALVPWINNTVLKDGIGANPTQFPGRTSATTIGGAPAQLTNLIVASVVS
jgi:hypothetical protein